MTHLRFASAIVALEELGSWLSPSLEQNIPIIRMPSSADGKSSHAIFVRTTSEVQVIGHLNLASGGIQEAESEIQRPIRRYTVRSMYYPPLNKCQVGPLALLR